jgi:alkaline phosphatase D
MGRPIIIKPQPTGTSRRTFFKRSGSAAAALAALPAVTLSGGSFAAGPVFQHGVASGDPLVDRVILWTRVTPVSTRDEIAVNWVVASDPAMTRPVRRGSTSAIATRDFSVKIDVTGLQPGTTYYYRFFSQNENSPVGRTRTLPVGATPRLRLAVVSCSNHAYGYFNAYRRIAERADLDAVLHLGDYLYEYGPNQYGSARTPEPPNEIITLADYRRRHAQYKRDADSQEMHRQHPLIAIWDDHETSNDAWKDGAENHQPETEGPWDARVNVALQAYDEWMPVRLPDAGRPRENQRGFQFGNLLELLMLEERLNARSQQLPATVPTPFGNGFVQAGAFADATRQLLGTTQEAWLTARLRNSQAQWKFLGQGVMFAQLKIQAAPLSAGGGVFLNSDQWDGYQPARDRVYGIFKGDAMHPPVNNCVVLTGDIHSSWAADLSQDPNNADLATGGYNPATGAGSRAVEFVGTSVTSPGVSDPTGSTAALLRSINPHFKYIDLNRRGYMLLDVTAQRTVCEWWYVDTVESISNIQTFGIAFQVQAGANRLEPASQTSPVANPPPLAPQL